MDRNSQKDVEPATATAPSSEQEGLYVYCIGRLAEVGSLGAIGIDGREVTAIGFDHICVAVHTCNAQPYESQDPERVASWVMAHHRVVDAAWSRYGTVLPLTFNTIIKGDPGRDASTNLLAWLDSEYETLKAKLEALAGKVEYGVKVFWDPQFAMRGMAQSDPELRKLQEEIEAKPRGTAFMYRKKLESLLKRKAGAMVEEECIALHSKLSRWADEVQIEKPKRESGQLQMLMNLSCLVSQTQVHDLEAELQGVSAKEGFSAQLVGPLPPYSFS